MKERPEPPVSCCGAFQGDVSHFLWDEVGNTWKCALRATTEPPKAPEEPRPEPTPAPSRPAARRTTTRKK